MVQKIYEHRLLFASDKVLLCGMLSSLKCLVLPDSPNIAPETSSKDVHLAKAQKSILIR